MRTQQEIVDRMKAESSIFAFGSEVLAGYLELEHLRPFCKRDADLADHKPSPLTSEHVLAEMRGYMEFAWGKALGHRSISASRSVEKFAAWLWLLGDDEMFSFAEADSTYAQYGVPVLKAISVKYGFPFPDGPAVARMAQGLPCTAGCVEGCGV